MVFKKNKDEAIGGNYKLKSIKVFGSKENLFQNVKKYRKVFDEGECRYIYAELAFYNKLFDEVDWNTEVRLVCKNAVTNKELCDLKKAINISKERNIIYVREGWGTPDPGWWKKGKYKWQLYIDNVYIGEAFFYVVNGGLVTPDHNPYFNIQAIKLFESPRDGVKMDKRKYLKAFNHKTTRYINVEMKLENLMSNEPLLPFELQFNFYNDSGQLKAYMEYFREIKDKRATILLDSGYGSQSGGYWYRDKYTLEVIFMDQLIAVIPFELGDVDVELDGSFSYSVQGRKTSDEEQKEKLTFEEAMQELEELIGLKAVKEQLHDFATYLQFLKIRKDKGIDENSKFNLNTIFMGNPGTGKTTVAHMLGKIYQSLDLLQHGRVHEVGRADLVGEFIGQTAPKTKKAIDKARGGILFIDEAYALTDRGNDGKDFGKEVIEVLIKELSDGPGDVAIVFAGYPQRMTNFLNSNPGLSSRLRRIIRFPDYTPDELMAIAAFSAQKRGVLIAEKASEYLHRKIIEIYRNRDEHFGNARYINGLVEEGKQNMALRLMKNFKAPRGLNKRQLSTIEIEDFRKIFRRGGETDVNIPIDEALLKDALEQLHALIGLDNVKKEVDEIAKLVRYYKEIGKDVKRSFSLHTVFKGNPGTGKTTVARIIVQIYKALGVLERGHLVEVDRKDLVAGFIGQTAIKTGEIIDKAMGGGLFIDEAYALSQGGVADFGREAIETMLKRMEDQRGEFMIIVAGYPKEMDIFLEANPGLMSRFDKQIIFKDYDVPQLLAIAEMLMEQEDLIMDNEAKAHLEKYISNLVSNKHKYFGNARTIRKIVEQAIMRQNLRMAMMAPEERTEEMILTMTLDDVQNFTLMEADINPGIGFGYKRS